MRARPRVPPDDPHEIWQERLELAMHHLHVALVARPGVAQILVSRQVPIPQLDSFGETLLAILADAAQWFSASERASRVILRSSAGQPRFIIRNVYSYSQYQSCAQAFSGSDLPSWRSAADNVLLMLSGMPERKPHSRLACIAIAVIRASLPQVMRRQGGFMAVPIVTYR
jgi:hypothetical protein